MPTSRSGRLSTAVLADGDERARRERARAKPSTSGHGSAREIDGLVGLDRGGLADRREVDEDVAEPRGAHGERRRERDRLVGLAGDRGRRTATWTSAAASTPMSLNARSSPGAWRARRTSYGSSGAVPASALMRRLRSSTSLSATTSGAGGRQANTPHGVPSTVGVSRPGHPAHEQVEHAGEMALGVIAAQPPAQVAVQRRGVQQRLQAVVRALHLRRERRGAVVPGGQRLAGRGQPVRLVVGDRERAPRPARRGRCCRSGSRARSPAGRGPRAVGVPGERVVGGQMRAQHRGDRARREPPVGLVAADERQLERQLVEPVRARDVAQPQPADERPERRLDRRAQPGDRSSPGRRCPPAAAPVPRRRCARARRRGRPRRSRSPRSTVWANVPNAPAGRQRAASGVGSGAAAPSSAAAGLRGGAGGARTRLVSGSSVSTASSGSLVTRASWAPAVMSL